MIDDEFTNRRQPPTTPYRPSGRILEAPESLLAQTLAALQSVPMREAACLWLGVSEGNSARVKALVVPRQWNRRLNYEIPAEAMQTVAELARPRGWTLLANIHSHPGADTEHSLYDDEMMPSRKALSLVFPWHGHWRSPWPYDAGVHEFVDDYWHLLTEDAAGDRIVWRMDLPLTLKDLR